MDEWIREHYLREIALQCRYAITAYHALQRELQLLSENVGQWMVASQPTGPAELIFTERVFFHIQALLVAAAHVSKLLWPSRNMKKANLARADARASALRQLLQVPELQEDSPIGNQKLRNVFEHFDDYLDKVLSQHANIADMNIGIVGMIQSNVPFAYLRNYDQSTHLLTYMEDELALPPLLTELERLAVLARELAYTGMRRQ